MLRLVITDSDLESTCVLQCQSYPRQKIGLWFFTCSESLWASTLPPDMIQVDIQDDIQEAYWLRHKHLNSGHMASGHLHWSSETLKSKVILYWVLIEKLSSWAMSMLLGLLAGPSRGRFAPTLALKWCKWMRTAANIDRIHRDVTLRCMHSILSL